MRPRPSAPMATEVYRPASPEPSRVTSENPGRSSPVSSASAPRSSGRAAQGAIPTMRAILHHRILLVLNTFIARLISHDLRQRDKREHSRTFRRIPFYSLYLDKDESP